MITRRMVKTDVGFLNLIDVTLTLLIIFMITAPAMQSVLPVDLPTGKTTPATLTEGIVVTVTVDGVMYIDNVKVAAEDFPKRLTEAVKKHVGEPVYLRGDAKVPYGSVMDVFNAVKELGVESVSLVVEEKITRGAQGK